MPEGNMEDQFEEPRPRRDNPDVAGFIVDLEGYEGPIDVLLTMARDQKVDLTQISILALADQYLAFVAEARRANLELAADYLVMAAWLAYLKSRLLLPEMGGADEPSGEEMAAALQFQLQRLEAMQESGQRLMVRPRLGADFHGRGEPESFMAEAKSVYEVSLYDLLRAYADYKKRVATHVPLRIEPSYDLHSVEDALKRLRRLLGPTPGWASLWRFLPEDLREGLSSRSAVAATFVASLEMVREGQARLRQDQAYGPIYLRGADPDEGGGDG